MSAMYSESLKAALERDVVGQPGAINMVVRGVTRAMGGFVSQPAPLCTFLLMGPAGTGKSHLARSLSRALHGDDSRFAAADCTSIGNADPWFSFVVQLLPLFGSPTSSPGVGMPSLASPQDPEHAAEMGPSVGYSGPQGGARFGSPHAAAPFYSGQAPIGFNPAPSQGPFPAMPTSAGTSFMGASVEPPPYSVLVVGDLERGRPEFGMTLIRALKTGHLPLPDGRSGSLRNCIVFLTSSLCSAEILAEKPGIGFSAAREAEEERAHVFKLCSDAAVKHWSVDLIAQLDDLIVFHRLEEQQLEEISDRLVAGLNRRLESRDFRCELTENGRRFLLQRGARDPRMGARCLVRAHKKHLEFPVADLAMSGRVPAGAVVSVDWKEGAEHLHFDVKEREQEQGITQAEISVG